MLSGWRTSRSVRSSPVSLTLARYVMERTTGNAPRGGIAGSMSRVTGIYDEPWAYELACSFRDVPGEVDVLLGWYVEQYGGLPSSVLELAAGPAEHSREFDRRGIKATALDLNPAMCAYAASKAAGLE